MNRKLLPFFTLLCIIASCLQSTNRAEALPISYPGGITIIGENNPMQHVLSAYYTVTPKFAAGLRHEYYPNSDLLLRGTFVVMSASVYRYNAETSRFSAYVNGGIGVINQDLLNYSPIGFTGKNAGGGFVGIAADWESRRFYVGYQGNYYISYPTLINNYIHSVRIGISPYIAEYGHWHTWFMVEVMHESRMPDRVFITPLIRLFKNVFMLEFGYSVAVGNDAGSIIEFPGNYHKIFANFQVRL